MLSVAVRIRPFSDSEENVHTMETMDDKVIVFDPSQQKISNYHRLTHSKRHHKDLKYGFDRVFDTCATQQHVFQMCSPILDGVLQGYHGTIFAYGCTGSGKTYTISGTKEDPGVIFLSIAYLFQHLPKDKEAKLQLSYLEIYNEQLYDLLCPENHLQLRQNGDQTMVSQVSVFEPESPEQVMALILQGNARRRQGPTEANAQSSRSHAILQVTLKLRDLGQSDYTQSKLSIIDLAGSERAATGHHRRREGANINKSLLALGNCINALCRKSPYVPFRDSKLTRLLKQSLNGNCRTLMICNVSPSKQHYEETHNTLKYANRAKNIKVNVQKNIVNVKLHISKYLDMISELKQENLRLKHEAQDGKDALQQALKQDIMEAINHFRAYVDDMFTKQTHSTRINKQLQINTHHIQCFEKVLQHAQNWSSNQQTRLKLIANNKMQLLEASNAQLLEQQQHLQDRIDDYYEELDTIIAHAEPVTQSFLKMELEKIQLEMQNIALSHPPEPPSDHLDVLLDMSLQYQDLTFLQPVLMSTSFDIGPTTPKKRPAPQSPKRVKFNLDRNELYSPY